MDLLRKPLLALHVFRFYDKGEGEYIYTRSGGPWTIFS